MCKLILLFQKLKISNLSIANSAKLLVVRCCLINNNRNLWSQNSYEYWWPEKPPEFDLPEPVSQYSFEPSLEQLNFMEGLCVTQAQSNLYEEETREQADIQKWHDLRAQRFSSTKFKEVCTRRADYESLAARQLKKTIQTAAMRHGINTVEEAAAAYAVWCFLCWNHH